MSRATPRVTGIYYPRTRSTSPPDYFIPREDAVVLIDDGAAIYINRGRDVRLREYDLRGKSCRPGPSFITNYLDRSQSDGAPPHRVVL